MRRTKKPILILLLTLCMFILIGWGKNSVDLLNDTPLIDLSKAIKNAPIGNQGNTLILQENEAKSDDTIVNNQADNISAKESGILQEEKKIHTIEIRDMTITYDNNKYSDVDALKTKIIHDCSNGAGSVDLVDNFAEAHVYNDVFAILEQLQETIGLEYQYD